MREEHVYRTLLRVADLNSTIMLRSSTFLYAQDCAAYRLRLPLARVHATRAWITGSGKRP